MVVFCLIIGGLYYLNEYQHQEADRKYLTMEKHLHEAAINAHMVCVNMTKVETLESMGQPDHVVAPPDDAKDTVKEIWIYGDNGLGLNYDDKVSFVKGSIDFDTTPDASEIRAEAQ